MPRVALTDRFVAGAKPADAPQVDYFDEGTPGLALRVSEARKAWTFIFTSPKDAKRARMTLGSYPSTSLAKARALALEAKGHVDGKVDPRDVFAARDANAFTVKTLADSYYEKHVRPNLRSASNTEQRFKRTILPVVGSVRLADLHRRDINRVLDPIVKRDSGIEANRVFAVMQGMFNWAVERGDLDRSPMHGMTKPTTETARERVLSGDEIQTIWRALPAAIGRSEDVQRIVKLCLVTGQRVGEIAGMRRDELDLKHALWSLPGSRTKNASPHTVPLSSLAVEIIVDALKSAAKDWEYVFPSGDESIRAHAIATTLRRAQGPKKKNPKGVFGIPAFTAHDLRRTVLTNLAQLGVQPIVIGAIANHRSVTKAGVTFAVYVKHDYGREKREALDLWAERLSGIIAGKAAKVVPIKGGATR